MGLSSSPLPVVPDNFILGFLHFLLFPVCGGGGSSAFLIRIPLTFLMDMLHFNNVRMSRQSMGSLPVES